jgi:hypothetical protein
MLRMTLHTFTRPVAVLFLAIAIIFTARAAAGQAPRLPGRPAQAAVSEQPQLPSTGAAPQNAEETRGKLKSLLEACPPTVGRVLKTDPTLISNQAYLAPYPALASFLSAHPEIGRDPRYFFESVWDYSRPDPRQQAIDLWEGMITGVAVFLVFVVITAAIVWLIRSVIDYRRWRQQSKMQLEVHNKLVDRITGSQELLAYVESPAGMRLLQSPPILMDAGPLDASLPVRRVLWAIQAGLVLVAGGAGLLFVSGRVVEDVQQPLFALGAVLVFVGTGFIVSAAASYGLTRRLGLLDGLGRESSRPPYVPPGA